MVGLLCRYLLKKVNISLHPFCYGVFIIAPLNNGETMEKEQEKQIIRQYLNGIYSSQEVKKNNRKPASC